jgi:3-oxoacyl-[acyl-carrier protein] reductase
VEGEFCVKSNWEAFVDLGIKGRTALVCAASRGLGRACALALAAEGAHVTITGRDTAALMAAHDELSALTGIAIQTAEGDIATEAGRDAALAACPEPDILITNAGGPPPGAFETWERSDWIAALDANMLAPVLMIRAVHRGMAERGFGRIVNITSAMIKAPLDILSLSAGARLGLVGAVAALARSGAARNVTINNLLPEMFDTDRLRSNLQMLADRAGHSLDVERDRRRSGVPAGRFGEPEEFGALCAFLCGASAGYITGQNIVIDGGAYAGTF